MPPLVVTRTNCTFVCFWLQYISVPFEDLLRGLFLSERVVCQTLSARYAFQLFAFVVIWLGKARVAKKKKKIGTHLSRVSKR